MFNKYIVALSTDRGNQKCKFKTNPNDLKFNRKK